MSGFKNGEWHLLAGRGIARVATGPGSLTVATVHENDGWDKYEVAKQIAKQHNCHADLLEACKVALDVLSPMYQSADGLWTTEWKTLKKEVAALRAAIAKAESR